MFLRFMLDFICIFAKMKVDGYKNITIATIFAVFLLQTIWLYNSFSVAVNKLTADVNAFLFNVSLRS